MNCISCNTEIQAIFKHAIVKNECPCCGSQILDEETMALIEDVEKTILNEAVVRDETAKKLALIIVAKYNITMKDRVERNSVLQKQMSVKTFETEKIKVAPPSAFQKMTNNEEEKNPAILEMSKLLAEQELSDSEREKILEEAVMEKYNMTNQTIMNSNFIEDEKEMQMLQNIQDKPIINKQLHSILAEAGTNPILEQERLGRLAKQQQALKAGGGSFRRGG